MSNVVIKAEHLSKMYRLGTINNGTLWKDMQTWAALKLGKEDPHSRIGEDKYSGDDDHFWALKDINFEIQQGDRVGIIGKNGAGKSTLLKLLSRVTSPTEGTIKIKGKIASLLEVGTGFNGELTGRENIYLNGAILGMKKRQIDRKLDEIIDFSEIEHHIDTPVKRYSSGMYVRLAFAVAAHLDSDILIADEVLAVGDAAFQKKALGKMNDLSTGQGRTVLFVSHNMGAIKTLCNTGIVLEKGLIRLSSDIDTCITQYFENTTIKGIEIKDRTDRIGNARFKFTKISFLNVKQVSVDSVMAGDFLRIKFNFVKDQEIDLNKMVFSIHFRDEYQRDITSFISDEINTRYSIENEECFFLEIPHLNIGPGIYNLRVFASYLSTGPSDICDLIENAAELQVLLSDFWGTGKTIRSRKEALLDASFLN